MATGIYLCFESGEPTWIDKKPPKSRDFKDVVRIELCSGDVTTVVVALDLAAPASLTLLTDGNLKFVNAALLLPGCPGIKPTIKQVPEIRVDTGDVLIAGRSISTDLSGLELLALPFKAGSQEFKAALADLGLRASGLPISEANGGSPSDSTCRLYLYALSDRKPVQYLVAWQHAISITREETDDNTDTWRLVLPVCPDADDPFLVCSAWEPATPPPPVKGPRLVKPALRVMQATESLEHARTGPAPFLVELGNLEPGYRAEVWNRFTSGTLSVDTRGLGPRILSRPAGGAADLVNAFLGEPVRRSLSTVRRGHAMSFVPRLLRSKSADDDGDAPIRAAGRLRYVVTASRSKAGSAASASIAPGAVTRVEVNHAFRLEFPGLAATSDATSSSITATAILGEPAETVEPQEYSFDAAEALTTAPAWRVAMSMKIFTWEEERQVRIGALDLTLKHIDSTPDQTTKRIEGAFGAGRFIVGGGVVAVIDAQGDTDRATAGISRTPFLLDAKLSDAPLVDLDPGATDPRPDERLTVAPERREAATSARDRSAQPLLIPRARSGGDTPPPLTLEVVEAVDTDRSRSLSLRIKRSKASSASVPDRRVLVLDHRPLTFAEVTYAPLWATGPLDEDVEEVARWSEGELEGSRWQVPAPADGFRLTFPPQTVGEYTEKGQSTWNGGEPVEAKKPFDFRLGPVALLKLDASFARQRYAEPGWNLRRVLGYAGQRAPGAGVRSLRTELLYGMTTTIDADRLDEQLRLSELFGRLGDVVDRVSDDDIGKWGALRLAVESTATANDIADGLRRQWDAHRRQIEARLGVFEVWSEGRRLSADETGVTALSMPEFKLDRFVSHELRTSADVAYPIPESRRVAHPSFPPTNPPFDSEGLQGGATWGFESDRILQEVLGQPRSTSGRIERLYLSALGGWGYQRAAFANDKTRIYSDTAMGRVSYYAVERIGRIGVFWNRAKHIIIYERCTEPAAQFAKWQPEHRGLPVLRKVREFVQFIECERHFPEKSSSTLPRGCIEAFVAGTPVIPVDSARWGRDLEDGYEIPLWQQGEDPAIYPRPVLTLVCAGDKEVTGSVERSIAMPQRLVFYTSTNPKHDANTDAWPPVAEVDFTYSAPPLPDTQSPLSDQAPDALRVPASVDVPGHERFTFPLLPGGGRINLVDGRIDATILADLHSVTMTRSTARRDAPAANAETAVIRLLLEKAGIQHAALETCQRALKEAAGVESAKDRVKERVREVLEAADRHARDLKRRLDEAKSGRSTKSIATTIDALRNELRARLKATVHGVLDAWQKQAEEGIDQVSTHLSTTLERLPTDAPAEKVKAAIKDASDEWKAIGDVATGLTTPLFRRVGELVTDAWEKLDAAAGVARQAIADLDVAISTGTPSMDAVLTAVHTECDRLVAALEAAEHSIPTDLPALLQPPAAKARALLKSATARMKTLRADIDALERASTTWLADARAKWPAAKADLAKTIDTTVAHLKATRNGITLWCAAIDAELPLSIKNLTQKVSTTLRTLGTVLTKALDELAAKAALTRALALETIDDWARQSTVLVKRLHDAARDEADRCIDAALDTTKPDDGWLDAFDSALESLNDVLDEPVEWVTRLSSAFDEQIKKTGAELDAAVDEIARKFAGPIQSLADVTAKAEAIWRRAALAPSVRDPGTTLALIRAASDGPLLPDVRLNRERLAYFFDDYAAAVRSSPVAALVNRANDDLKAMGLRIPTDQLLERLVPASLENFDIASIFPDFAGLRNDGFFSGIKMPEWSKDTVHITHGIDKEHQSAWLKADIDLPMADNNEVFVFGPLSLVLLTARFTAHAEVKVGADGRSEQFAEADIVGDWSLRFGGASLVTFTETTLHYDRHGHLDFNIEAEKIKLDQALDWLGKAIRAFSKPGKPLKLELVMDGGLPTGVRAVLDLPLPPLGAGAVSITGLALSALLELGVRQGDFFIGIGFCLGRQKSPFTLMIAFLGGGGYIESKAIYTPSNGRVASDVSIGLVAGAGAAFNFGPANGTVRILVGVFVEFHSTGPGAGLSIGVMLLVSGNCVLFGFVSIGISLLLQLVYSPNGSLIGTGTLEVEIELSVFKTISVCTQVQYVLQKGSGTGTDANNAAKKRMSRYK